MTKNKFELGQYVVVTITNNDGEAIDEDIGRIHLMSLTSDGRVVYSIIGARFIPLDRIFEEKFLRPLTQNEIDKILKTYDEQIEQIIKLKEQKRMEMEKWL